MKTLNYNQKQKLITIIVITLSGFHCIRSCVVGLHYLKIKKTETELELINDKVRHSNHKELDKCLNGFFTVPTLDLFLCQLIYSLSSKSIFRWKEGNILREDLSPIVSNCGIMLLLWSQISLHFL